LLQQLQWLLPHLACGALQQVHSRLRNQAATSGCNMHIIHPLIYRLSKVRGPGVCIGCCATSQLLCLISWLNLPQTGTGHALLRFVYDSLVKVRHLWF
jgi:hypothetical protein